MLNSVFDRFRRPVFLLATLYTVLASAGPYAVSAEEAGLSDQRMAATPQELIKILSDAAYLKPDEYKAKWDAVVGEIIHPLGLNPLAQRLDEKSDPRRDIKAEDIEASIDVLTGISLQSKDDGELI